MYQVRNATRAFLTEDYADFPDWIFYRDRSCRRICRASASLAEPIQHGRRERLPYKL